MDRLAIIEGQKNVATTVRFPIEVTIETMDRLPIIEGQRNVETTVRFSNRRKDLNYL